MLPITPSWACVSVLVPRWFQVRGLCRVTSVSSTSNTLSGEEPSAMPVVDERRGFGAADQTIEVFENLVVGAVRAVCEEVCEQWRSLRETK